MLAQLGLRLGISRHFAQDKVIYNDGKIVYGKIISIGSNVVYFKNSDSSVQFKYIQFALSAYVSSLQGLNSAFDKYVRGESKTISKSVKNGYNSDRGGGFKKLIYQYSLTGELESTFQSLEEASKSSSISEDSISHACVGDRKTSNGFYWTYTTTFDFKEDIRKKKVIQYDLEGEKIHVYNSIAEASRTTEINKSSIAKCCRGERIKAGNFIWKFSD